MAKEITMPQMGFDMTEGTIANWLKAEGDSIKKGEPVAEIETDKTTIQIEAFDSGVLLKILAPVGAKVPVGQPIALVGQPGEAVPPPADGAPAVVTPDAVPVQAESPAAPAAEVKATPIAQRIAAELGVDLALVKGTGPDGQIRREDVESYAQARKTVGAASPAVVNTGRIVASPAAKRLAEQRGVDLRLVKGSGPDGRIVLEDVEKFAASVPAAAPAPAPIAPPAPAVAPQAAPQVLPRTAAGVRKALSRMRQTIAQRMTESKTTTPHFYITLPVEMDAALALRQQINESLKPENLKVSVNDMVVRATALALRRFPNLNASFDGDAIVLHEQIHVGVAVAVEGGLVTVTVRDTDKKTLREIAAESAAMAARARDNKLQPTDLGGQTFTVSNLGMYGITVFSAIINPPDTGILAVGAATPTPVVRDSEVVIRNIMNITLSGDHRVTDGAEGALFVNEIKRLLENPWGLVL
ncbi:MAG: 2-oxo acid dehydrogenase subunit E2 [Anaerolineae bacterium]